MTKHLVSLGVAAILALAGSASSASAQSPARLSSLDRAELAAIDAESHTASDVYYTSLGLTLGGGALAGVGLGLMISDFSLSGSHSAAGPAGFVVSMIGTALGGVGLFILLPIAIGLDVDSGSRRGALWSRARITGGPGEVGLGMAIDF